MSRFMLLCVALLTVSACQTTRSEWVDKGELPIARTFGSLKELVSKPEQWTIKAEERGGGVEFSEEWELPNKKGFILVHGFRSGYYFREQGLLDSMKEHQAYSTKKGFEITEGPRVDNGFWYYAKKGNCVRFMKAIEVEEGGSIGRGPTHYWTGHVCGPVFRAEIETVIHQLGTSKNPRQMRVNVILLDTCFQEARDEGSVGFFRSSRSL